MLTCVAAVPAVASVASVPGCAAPARSSRLALCEAHARHTASGERAGSCRGQRRVRGKLSSTSMRRRALRAAGLTLARREEYGRNPCDRSCASVIVRGDRSGMATWLLLQVLYAYCWHLETRQRGLGDAQPTGAEGLPTRLPQRRAAAREGYVDADLLSRTRSGTGAHGGPQGFLATAYGVC